MVLPNKFFNALITLLIAIAQPVFGQQPDTLIRDLDPIQIEAIYSTVSPGDAPLSLSIVKRSPSQLNANASLTMDDIVNSLPGIWANNRENYALGERITIRGLGWRAAFGVRGIQVIMDGIPLTVADGQSMLNAVDPAFVRSIELIRGPASSFWGNSSGGVLYLSTFASPEEFPLLRLRSTGGSHGLLKQDLQFSHSFGSHKVSAFSSYLSQDGYRNYSASRVFRNGIKGTIDINDQSRIEYIGAFVGMPKAQHPSSLTMEQLRENPRQANQAFVQSDAGKQVYQGQAGVHYYRDSSLGFLTLTGYGIYRDLTNPLPFAVIDLARQAGGLRGTLENTFGDLKLKTGFDTKLQHDDRKEYENNGGARGTVTVNQVEEVTNQAVFTTLEYDPGGLSLLGGLRYDRITFSADTASRGQTGSRTFNALSPSIGLTYKTANRQYYANMSTSYEAPTTTELVNRPDGGNGFNPRLKPERTFSAELGSRGALAGSTLKYNAAIYRLWIKDLLFPYQLQSNGPTFYRNQGETTHTGFEMALNATPLPPFSIDLTYNYTKAVFEKGNTGGNDLEGNRVPGIPLHRVFLSAGYNTSSLRAGINYHFVSSYFADNLNTASVDPYGVTGLYLSWKKRFPSSGISIQPYLDINNIFDLDYVGSIVPNAFGNRYYEPAAGRNLQAGLSVSFD